MSIDQNLSVDENWCLPEIEADAFLSMVRRGERPSIEDVVARYPGHEDDVRRECRLLMFAENMISKSRQRRAVRQDAPDLETIADYKVTRLIGRGGMGFVYEAAQPHLSRPVAIKVLAEDSVTSRRIHQRFALEAEAASRLHHPNIVPVFDYGEDNGYKYLVMLYVDGCNLNQILRRSMNKDADDGSVPPECADAISSWEKIAILGAQVADGLYHAHLRGMIHRDIKPANLLLDRDGNIFIADFGLAKIRDEDADLSRTGDTIGTPRYMSPEAMRGLADERSDIFGLGVTLYELIARTEAFTGTNAQQILSDRSVLQLPPLQELNPDVPEALAEIVRRACALDPRDRYQTAEELQYELNEFAHGNSSSSRRRRERSVQTPQWKTTRFQTVAATISLAALATGYSAWSSFHSTGEGRNASGRGVPEFVGLSDDRTLTIEIPEGTTAIHDNRLQAYDPDGECVRYCVSGGDDADLFAIHPDTGVILFRENVTLQSPLDQNQDSIYEVDVLVTDSRRAELMQFVDAPTDGGLRLFEPVRSTVANTPWTDKRLASSLLCVASPDGRTFLHGHDNGSNGIALYRTSRDESGLWSAPSLVHSDCRLPANVRGLSTVNGSDFFCLTADRPTTSARCQLLRCRLQQNGTFAASVISSVDGLPGNTVGLWQYDQSSLMYFVSHEQQLEQWFAVIQPNGILSSSLVAVGPWHSSLTMIDAAGWLEPMKSENSSLPARLRIRLVPDK